MDLRRIDHGACDSTNERALEALATGTARHGDVHTALEQTRGRGQRGRAWWSAPTRGLYLTLVWAPDAPLDPALLTMAAGLGALDCARSAGATTAQLDWPNDVLVDGAKLAGVLVEARSLGGGRTGCAVGVGLNVAQAEFPGSLTAERLVTSLALLGHGARPLDLAAVATSFGFEHPPKVTLMLKANAKEAANGGRKGGGGPGGKKGREQSKAGSGHKFSADNPYGQRQNGDARQFAH